MAAPERSPDDWHWQPGDQLLLKTSFGEELAGEVFSYDAAGSGLLVLRQPGDTPQQSDLRMIRREFITAVTRPQAVVASSSAPEDYDLRLPPVDGMKGTAREQKAVYLRRQQEAKIGVGVSPEAQAIFLALAKTMTCHWDGPVINVLEEVIIPPPYGLEQCQLVPTGDPRALERVKLVLKEERARLGLLNGSA